MRDTRDAFGPLLTKLQAELRSVKRDMAMLRAQVSDLPTVAQFQAGLDSIDARITETHSETLVAIGALTALVRERMP